jgi:hypothetical protein
MVRIADRAVLDRFRETWKFHDPLELSQLACAGQTATVREIGFHFGGDFVYRLDEIPGIWHEQCLCAPVPAGQPAIPSQTAFDELIIEVAQPEICVDCASRLGGEDHGRNWHLCKYCGEAVCESCGVTHYCEKQRSMNPHKRR